MGTRHPIHLEGNVTHFASSKESVRVRLAPFPRKKKVDALTFTITDREGATVYRQAWPGEGASLLPPREFVWDGRINQGGDGFVTPLGAPYEIVVEVDLSDEVPLTGPTSDVSASDPTPSSCPFENPAALLEIVATAGSAKSTSYRHVQDGIDQLVIAGGKAGRFFYAAGAADTDEPPLVFAAKLRNHDEVERLRLVLFNSREARVWEKEITTGFAAEMKIPGDEVAPLLTATGAPYKLKASIDAPSVVPKEDVAWTYIDVAVEKVELFWGMASMLGPRAGAANIKLEEALILRALKGITPAAPDPRSESQAVSDDTSAGEKPVPPDGAHAVELSSNIFYQNVDEWQNDTAFREYRNLWGDGPRIPLVAKVYARSSAGKAVAAPQALRGAQLLWDWEDPKADKKGGVETSDWLEWAIERYDHEGGDHNPPSTNCHVAFGGKRGEGAPAVFPAQARGGTFPFEVTPFGRWRPWAALSKVDDACKTGVIFQPSRMAGDTWRVRAYCYTGDPEEFSSSEPDLAKAAKTAGLPSAATGTFEIWRRVDVLLYLKKAATLPDVDLSAVNKVLAPTRVKLVMPPADAAAVSSIFGDHLRELFKNPRGAPTLNVMAPLDEQNTSPYALKLKSWDALASKAVLDGLDAYIKSLKKTEDRDRVTLAKRRLEAAQRGHWRSLAVYLGPADCRALEPFVQQSFPNNANGIKCSVTSLITNLASLMMHLGSQGIRTSLNPNVLLPVVKSYVDSQATLNGDKKPLGGQAGLYVLHMAAVFPGQHDLSGGAVGVDRGADVRGRGMFFFAYPPVPDDVIVIDPTQGDFAPFMVPATVSATFKSESIDDYQALIYGSANGAIVKALAAVIRAGEKAAETGSKAAAAVWGDPAAVLAGKSTNLRVRSRNGGLVADAVRLLKHCLAKPALRATTREGKEGNVFLSLSPELDKSNAFRLSFGLWKEGLSATLQERAVRALHELYERSWFPVTEIYVYYKKGSKLAKRRADAVIAFLDGIYVALGKAITVNAGKDDAKVPASYDVNTLFTHELGHTMFLPHTEPEDSNYKWRHVQGYPCLMNYDPSHTEFCGVCMLALRGWDIGTSSAPKLDGGPPWGTKATTRPDYVPSLEDVPLPDYSPPPVSRPSDGWEHAGYHGTSSTHHDSLSGGLRHVPSAWDPASGGELGPGFYLTTDFGTACLYGVDSAQLHNGDVEVWEVEWRSDESEWGDGLAVPLDEQWGKMKQEYCVPPYDYLWNAAEDPPVQYKVNGHAYNKLRLSNPRRMTVDEAFGEADKALSRPAEKKIPRVKVTGDGDCFFHSVAFWVKASREERQSYFDDSGKTYGTTEAELRNTATVRTEIANWLAKQIFDVDRASDVVAHSAPTTVNGARYLSTWNNLTNNGADVTHFGRDIAETIRDMPLNRAAATIAGKELIWGDAGFMWRAVQALYDCKLYVHHGGREPQVFGDGATSAHVIHSGAHYDVLRGDSRPEDRV